MVQPVSDYKILSFYHEAKKLIKGKMVVPRLISVWTTNYCNLRCLGCWYFNKNGKENHVSMDVTKYKKFVDEIKSLGTKSVELSVAESTIHPEFCEMVKYSKTSNLSVAVITNGTVLNSKYLEKNGLDIKSFSFIRISLDYSNPKSYLSGKGADLFEQVVDNTKSLLDIRGIEVRPRIGFKFILNTRNLIEMTDMVALSESVGVDYVQFKAEHSSDSVIDDRQARYADMQIRVLRKKAGIPVYGKVQKNPCIIKCFMSPIHAIIDCLGNVYTCCHFSDKRGFIGNAFEEGFSNLWFSEKHKNTIDGLSPQMCEQASGGGCRWFKYNDVMNRVINGHEGDLEFI